MNLTTQKKLAAKILKVGVTGFGLIQNIWKKYPEQSQETVLKL